MTSRFLINWHLGETPYLLNPRDGCHYSRYPYYLFTTNSLSVTAILPPEVLGKKASPRMPQGPATAENVTVSYEAARKDCITKVAKIIQECRRINEKYSDPYFDLEAKTDCNLPLSIFEDRESDSSAAPLTGTYNLMKDNASAGRIELYATDTSEESLTESTDPSFAPSVKRVADIFDNPQFFVDGASSQDIKQGQEGDCWFLSALSALCSLENGEQLIERVCPAEARDPEVGVYGFLFYRDGEWTSVVIDDKLYLLHPDYDYGSDEVKDMWGSSPRYDAAEEYRKAFQVSFAYCRSQFSVTHLGRATQEHYTTHKVHTRMSVGFRCWKKPMPKVTAV